MPTVASFSFNYFIFTLLVLLSGKSMHNIAEFVGQDAPYNTLPYNTLNILPETPLILICKQEKMSRNTCTHYNW